MPKTLELIVYVILGLAGLTGCQPGQPHLGNNDSSVEAISNRPQSYDRFIAILKLRTPALLDGAFKDPTTGLVKTNPARKSQLEAEQASAQAELAGISPEIKVLNRYRMVLNGLAVVAPKYLEAKILGLEGVAYVEIASNFERLETSEPTPGTPSPDLATKNSATFIGAAKIRELLKVKNTEGQDVPVDGRGMRVGVIDTGIDYTHGMFGGPGRPEDYQGQKKDSLEDGGFPNAKVIGGYDFVGSDFNSGSPHFDQHIPRPDGDPIDEGGHGTHVAGSIAGIGNGTDTYDGVAPGASLFALKVFGANGSTNDSAVLAALEYAADPNGDLDPADRLDVVNLSLGSGFGTPHVLYNEAIASLTRGDVVVVASAGNSGEKPHIVGSPSTADEALSVAASIDHMSHNWQFRAVAFLTPAGKTLFAEAVEATVGKPIADSNPVTGPLVYLGTAASPLTEDQKAAVRGKVALMDRGEVAFAEKIKKAAEAGAIGVVVANNQPGDPFTMGGEGSYQLPAIMISQTLGQELRQQMLSGDVVIDFVTPTRIEKPEVIDTLTGFSSRGPRSLDGSIKPEIAAPGANIISAKMGGGTAAVKLSGTSMAAPHMAGVMALLKQARPTLTVSQLKSLAISTATTMKSKAGTIYPVAYGGAGRVQAYEAATAPLTLEPATFSLGEVYLDGPKSIKRSVLVTNTSSKDVSFTLEPEGFAPGLTAAIADGAGGGIGTITLKAGKSLTVPVTFQLRASGPEAQSSEKDGFLRLKSPAGGEPIVDQKIPVLGVVNPISRIKANEFNVLSSSADEAAGALSQLTLENGGRSPGTAMLFNLIADDQRKPLAAATGTLRPKACDLESAGWRLVKGKDAEGFDQTFIEFAVKLYAPLTTWNLCEVSIQVDGDGDNKADQELLGTSLNNFSGNEADVDKFASVLTDAGKMAQIRRSFELQFPKVSTANYQDAVVDKQNFIQFSHSTLAVVRADLGKLRQTPSGDLKIKIATLGDPSTPVEDDYLGGDQNQWRTLLTQGNSPFEGLGDYTLNPGQIQKIDLTKGPTPGDLLVYLPNNPISWSPTVKDSQSLVVTPTYQDYLLSPSSLTARR